MNSNSTRIPIEGHACECTDSEETTARMIDVVPTGLSCDRLLSGLTLESAQPFSGCAKRRSMEMI